MPFFGQSLLLSTTVLPGGTGENSITENNVTMLVNNNTHMVK